MAKRKKKGKRPNNNAVLQREIAKATDDLRLKVSANALEMLTVIPAYVLHTEFGFGKKRALQFMNSFFRVSDAVVQGQVKIDTLHEELKQALGIEVDIDWKEACKDYKKGLK